MNSKKSGCASIAFIYCLAVSFGAVITAMHANDAVQKLIEREQIQQQQHEQKKLDELELKYNG